MIRFSFEDQDENSAQRLTPVVRFVISWVVALLLYSSGYLFSEEGFEPLFDSFFENNFRGGLLFGDDEHGEFGDNSTGLILDAKERDQLIIEREQRIKKEEEARQFDPR